MRTSLMKTMARHRTLTKNRSNCSLCLDQVRMAKTAKCAQALTMTRWTSEKTMKMMKRTSILTTSLSICNQTRVVGPLRLSCRTQCPIGQMLAIHTTQTQVCHLSQLSRRKEAISDWTVSKLSAWTSSRARSPATLMPPTAKVTDVLLQSTSSDHASPTHKAVRALV